MCEILWIHSRSNSLVTELECFNTITAKVRHVARSWGGYFHLWPSKNISLLYSQFYCYSLTPLSVSQMILIQGGSQQSCICIPCFPHRSCMSNITTITVLCFLSILRSCSSFLASSYVRPNISLNIFFQIFIIFVLTSKRKDSVSRPYVTYGEIIVWNTSVCIICVMEGRRINNVYSPEFL